MKFNLKGAATFSHKQPIGQAYLTVPVVDVQSLGSMNSSVSPKGNKQTAQ